MDVVHQEHPLPQAGKDLLHPLHVEPAPAAWARIPPKSWVRRRETKNIRSASFKWAIEKMETLGFPAAVKNIRSMESGSLSSQAENPGAARRLLSFMAKANRSLEGKKDSRSKTPMRATGGVWIAWMNPARSRSCPFFQAVSRMVERRMCSLLWMGSADVPKRLSRVRPLGAIPPPPRFP